MQILTGKMRFSIISGVFLLVILLALPVSSCKFNTIERIEETREMMGTYVTITVFSDSKTGTEAINAVFDRIEEIVDIASIYDENSEASILNKNGYVDNPSPEFLELINTSINYYHITGGYFDITIQPLWVLWSEGLWKESEEVQAEKVIKETLAVVGSDKIEVGDSRIEFLTNGMAITLNAIAKGYAADEAIEIIKEFGIKQALVDAGGDIYAMGTKSDGAGWTIPVLEPPVDYDSTDSGIEPLPVFVVTDRGVATSGNYFNYYDPEGDIGHIIDPLSGYSSTSNYISVTIIANSCMLADILATSVFAMGPGDGMDLVESLENVETFIIDSDRKIFSSSGLLEYIK